jgi:predicted DsbA family dithiol-disulfide isomerase
VEVCVVSVEVWSDVACPWCYLGKRRLEKAIEASGLDVDVRDRSFQLDPTIPHGQHLPHAELMAKKFGASDAQIEQMNQRLIDLGAAEGLDYRFDLYMQANTRDAHRLLHFAHERGRGVQLKDRLLRAQFTEGALVDDVDTLVALAAEVGLDEGDARAVLTSDAYDADVQADIDEAKALGANGVPFFVFDRRFAVSGAQSLEVFEEALRQSSEAAEL